MDMIIQIKKAEIFDEVAKVTAYIGAKTIDDSGLAYDRVFATDDDRVLLDLFWRNGLMGVVGMCKRYLSGFSMPGNSQEIDMSEVFHLTLNMPNNYNHQMRGALEASFRLYCINKIVSDWLMITNKSEAEIYIQKATVNGLDAMSLLSNRIIPKR